MGEITTLDISSIFTEHKNSWSSVWHLFIRPRGWSIIIFPTPFTPESSISPRLNPFIVGPCGVSTTQKDYQHPRTDPKRIDPFIAGSLFLPNVSPTPSGYQCPPSTPTSCITPKVQLKDFKYSDLQELGQSPRFKVPSRLANFSPKGKSNQAGKLFKNQEDLLNEFNQLEFWFLRWLSLYGAKTSCGK